MGKYLEGGMYFYLSDADALIDTSEESRKEWMLKIFKDAAFKHKRNADYQFWTHDNHAEQLYWNKFLEQKLNYIHQNLVRAGIVINAEDYKYSSARDYADGKGLLKILKIVLMKNSIEGGTRFKLNVAGR